MDFDKKLSLRPPRRTVLDSTSDVSSSTLHVLSSQVRQLYRFYLDMRSTFEKNQDKYICNLKTVQLGYRNTGHGTRPGYSFHDINLHNEMKINILKVIETLNDIINYLIEHIPGEFIMLHHWRDVVINVKRLLFDVERLYCDGNMLTRRITVENCDHIQIGIRNKVQFGHGCHGLVKSIERLDEDWFNNISMLRDKSVRIVFRQYGSYSYKKLDLWPRSRNETEIVSRHPRERNRDAEQRGGLSCIRDLVDLIHVNVLNRERVLSGSPVHCLDSSDQRDVRLKLDKCSSNHQLGGQRIYSVVESGVGREVRREILRNSSDISLLRDELLNLLQRVKDLRRKPLTEVTEVTVIDCRNVQMGISNTMIIK